MTIVHAGDSRDIRIPVMAPDGSPVDLTGADLTWTLAEWAGGDALVTKVKAAAGPETQIAIENGPDSGVPNQMVVKVLSVDTVLPGGVYVQLARTSISGAVDTVFEDTLEIKDVPQEA